MYKTISFTLNDDATSYITDPTYRHSGATRLFISWSGNATVKVEGEVADNANVWEELVEASASPITLVISAEMPQYPRLKITRTSGAGVTVTGYVVIRE